MLQEKTAEYCVPGCKGGLGLAAVVPRVETSVSAYAQCTGCSGFLSEALNSLLLCK